MLMLRKVVAVVENNGHMLISIKHIMDVTDITDITDIADIVVVVTIITGHYFL